MKNLNLFDNILRETSTHYYEISSLNEKITSDTRERGGNLSLDDVIADIAKKPVKKVHENFVRKTSYTIQFSTFNHNVCDAVEHLLGKYDDLQYNVIDNRTTLKYSFLYPAGAFTKTDEQGQEDRLSDHDAFRAISKYLSDNYNSMKSAHLLYAVITQHPNIEDVLSLSFDISDITVIEESTKKHAIAKEKYLKENKIREGLDDSERTDLSSVLNSISQLKYKLNHYLSGNCYGTTQELQEYLKDLSSQLEEIWANIVNEISD